MDLGNIFFRLGLNTGDFDKKLQDELKNAKDAAKEISKAFENINMASKKAAGSGGSSSAASQGQSQMNDQLKVTDDLYQKLANSIRLVAEQQNKIRINASYGFNGKYVQDAISQLGTFKSLLTDALNSGSRREATAAMKLFSNKDYAALNAQVQNIIRDGDAYNRSLQRQQSAQQKTQTAEERRMATLARMSEQYQKLTEAINKTQFAQSHTNKGGVSAAGPLTSNAISQLRQAQQELQNTMIGFSNGQASRIDVQTSMNNATRAIREATSATQQQRTINTETQRQQIQGQSQILAKQRAINAAMAENAKLIARSNSHFSILRTLVGQVGAMMGMYFSAFAIKDFIGDLVRIRGEFEQQYTALKAILQSTSQADELFSQLKTLAPISPYSFRELTTYAKQLSAYQIPYNDLFDTTKRLADLSAGLGVDFRRISLAYGQVRSAAVLRGQELRQFTEAGVPMVDALAKKFSKLRGEVVSTGDVFQLISERQVPFEMVKEVIEDLTNEGGIFYNMQEKQSETLAGKVSNLADRYDIMMNNIGQSTDGLLKGVVDGLATVMEHGGLLIKTFISLAAAWGAVKIVTTANATAIGSNVNAMITEEARSRVRQANLLREAQLYRTLTAEEKQALYLRQSRGGFLGISRTSLSSQELGALALQGRISKNEALRLAYIGKINDATMRHLVTERLITNEERMQVLQARGSYSYTWKKNLALRANLAIMRSMSALGSVLQSIFNPATLVMGGLTAIFTIILNCIQKSNELASRIKQMGDQAKETYNDIRQFMTDNPINLPIKITDVEQSQKLVESYREQLSKDLPMSVSNGLIASIYVDKSGNENSLDKQLERVKQISDALSQASLMASQYSSFLEEAANDTDKWDTESLATNLKDASKAYQEFHSELYSVSKIDILNAINTTPNLYEWFGSQEDIERYKKQFATLKKMLTDGKSSMESIYAEAKRVQSEISKTEPYRSHTAFLDKIGFEDVHRLEGVINSPNGDVGTMIEQTEETAKNFLAKLKNANIDPMSDAGKIMAAKLKDGFLQNAEISDEHIRSMFNFIFDKQLYGSQEAVINKISELLQGKLSQTSMDAVRTFRQDAVWTTAMTSALNEAKEKFIAEFPQFREDIEAAWKSPTLYAQIKVATGAVALKDWQKEMINTLKNSSFEVVIRASSNINEAIESIKSKIKDAKDFIKEHGDLALKIGVKLDKQSLERWFKSTKPTEQNAAEWNLVQGLYKSLNIIDDGQKGADKGWWTMPKDKGNKNKNKNKSDTYTEKLRRRYESLKKAIGEYRKLIQSMDDVEAQKKIKDYFGFTLDSRYLTRFGTINLAEDYRKKIGNRKGDTASSFRETLNNDITAARVERLKYSYDALAEARLEDIKLTNEQYKAYDELFKKTGNAKLSSLMAFGSSTKPYGDAVEYMKAQLVKMGDEMKIKGGISFDKMLGFSPEQMKNVQPNLKKLFDQIQEYIKKGGENARKTIEDVFAKTEDEDVKIAVNNGIRNETLKNLTTTMPKGANESDSDYNSRLLDMQNVINNYYDKQNKELVLDKVKKSLNWNEVFGDIGSLSYVQLGGLISQLEEIVRTNNDLDPQKMKEWVSQLDKLKEAQAQLEPYRVLFQGFIEVNRTRKERNSIARQIEAMPVTKYYRQAQNQGDTATVDLLSRSLVVLNGKTMTYAQSLEQLNISTKEYKKAQAKAQASAPSGWITRLLDGKEADNQGSTMQKLTSFGDTMSMISQNAKSMDEFRKNLGIGDNTAVGMATRSISALTGGVSNAVNSLKSGDFFGALNSMYTGFTDGVMDVFFSDTTTAKYEQAKENYNNLVEVWDKLIERKKAYLELAYTGEISGTNEEMRKILDDNQKAARTLGKQFLNSGASWKTHSQGVRQREGISDDAWKQFYQYAYKNNVSTSVASGRMTGLFDLSVDQLIKLQEEAPLFWAQLNKESKDYLQTIIDTGDKLDEINKNESKWWTQTDTDSIINGFASALDSMDDQALTFSNNFTKMLRAAVLNALLQSSEFKAAVTAWTKKFKEYMQNDGTLDTSEIEDLKNGKLTYKDEDGKEYTINGWNGIVDLSTSYQDRLKQLGLYEDQSAGSLSGGIKSITEETADLLASYVNAIRADVAFIRAYYVERISKDNSNQSQDIITNISVQVAKIEANTRQSAMNTDEIVTILKGVIKTTSFGPALRMA